MMPPLFGPVGRLVQPLHDVTGRKVAGEAGSRCIQLGGCQNYGPFLGPYYNTATNI